MYSTTLLLACHMRQCCCRRPGALSLEGWRWLLLPPLFRISDFASLLAFSHPSPSSSSSSSSSSSALSPIACIAHPRVYHCPLAEFGCHHHHQRPLLLSLTPTTSHSPPAIHFIALTLHYPQTASNNILLHFSLSVSPNPCGTYLASRPPRARTHASN
ncbi:uncharacterized protein LY79DRAFT_557667 [Colletotrichum navitas]|uniref:Uncharacterized protein n=1 Tax=Colletotrichum navitas TaxID=681940 RepID=A0AAD8PWE4_9PEZI|nr:uncharacterized protein LY79DRAFT_557667 [Colletotrichum navitas]KAK1585947.1 hypothetical protein LY79DRAFT_557667 [Colletotrichum navitas]